MRFRWMISSALLLSLFIGGHTGPGAHAQADPTLMKVNLFAADRALLVGYWLPAASDGPAPAVLLLHMLNGSAIDWRAFMHDLASAGIHALAVDLRGHGESAGAQDWALAQADLAEWWEWLAGRPSVQTENMAVAGASIGANLALIGCAEWENCRGAIALSPGWDYRGLRPAQSLQSKTSPAMLVAARGDTNSAASVLRLAASGTSELRLWLLAGSAHGTRLFAEDFGERLRASLLNELESRFATAIPEG